MRLRDAGVAARLQVWDRQVHAFPEWGFLPEAWHALHEINDFIDRLTRGAAP